MAHVFSKTNYIHFVPKEMLSCYQIYYFKHLSYKLSDGQPTVALSLDAGIDFVFFIDMAANNSQSLDIG